MDCPQKISAQNSNFEQKWLQRHLEAEHKSKKFHGRPAQECSKVPKTCSYFSGIFFNSFWPVHANSGMPCHVSIAPVLLYKHRQLCNEKKDGNCIMLRSSSVTSEIDGALQVQRDWGAVAQWRMGSDLERGDATADHRFTSLTQWAS